MHPLRWLPGQHDHDEVGWSHWLFLLSLTLRAGLHTGPGPSPGEIQANPLSRVINFPDDQAFVSRSCHQITGLVYLWMSPENVAQL